ncbi:MAG TPA: hypothetical protein VGD78_10275 [Chthoniobacterales bacterium]
MDAPEPDQTRKDVAGTDENFFNQSGLVTDEFKESDTSDENRAINRDPAQGHDSGEVHPS